MRAGLVLMSTVDRFIASVVILMAKQHCGIAAWPDVVLMDINLPGMLGPECVSKLKSFAPKLPVLMLTVYDDKEQIFKSLMATHRTAQAHRAR